MEVTGKPKVTYIGYSQGSAQGLYAMAKDQDYYADRINRLIMVGPCMMIGSDLTGEQLAAKYIDFKNQGKLIVGGGIG